MPLSDGPTTQMFSHSERMFYLRPNTPVQHMEKLFVEMCTGVFKYQDSLKYITKAQMIQTQFRTLKTYSIKKVHKGILPEWINNLRSISCPR